MKTHLESRDSNRLGQEVVSPACNRDARQSRSASSRAHMNNRLTTNPAEVTCGRCKPIAKRRAEQARAALNDAAARVNNAVLYGTPEMVAEAESKFQALLAEGSR